MRNSNQELSIAEQRIHRSIEVLTNLFLSGRATLTRLIRLNEKVTSIDNSNSDFHEVREDRREHVSLNLKLALSCLSVLTDFILLYNAISILCSSWGLPSIIKYIFPVCLIIMEIGVGYFQIVKLRLGQLNSFLTRNVQYFVIVLLIALSLLVVYYSAESYDQRVDQISFVSYMVGTVTLQALLLIFSISFHIWIIKSAEEIAEAYAYFKYRWDRAKLTKQIAKLEHQNTIKNSPEFIRKVQVLVREIEMFTRNFPSASIDFSAMMPADLIAAINQVMGRNVF